MEQQGNFSSASRRPRPAMLVAIVLFHVVAIYLLARAFAPDFTASVERSVVTTFTVIVETKDTPPPATPESDAGAQVAEGKKAVPKPTTAPTPKVAIRPTAPEPKATSTGTADSSGAKNSGTGTGAGGQGAGTGSGNGGTGQGGGIATKPVKIAGDINNARDFPIPPGGRQARLGTEVIVRVVVGTDGRASNCSVYKPSPDPEADAIVCRLVVERLRFKPATDSAGNPVAAPYYWRQRWF
ncbi:TonB family protein [Tsuneonella suprasediminis]|uniref:TonB family protein n=1 Tax=Tsuneonella suprasediminis TaxID=2306996 RepID=A0A419R5W1_9SPHN|nr:TonB family protein [Tsuneonella suprasediminis]RJX71138.1 TonB family protein [Tsuneonella suprasediminis]